MTSKRTVENYIHPVAVQQACGIELTFDDDTDVASLLALELMKRSHGTTWADLPYKRQRRLHEKAKRILNRKAVHFMTLALVAEQDRGGEIVQWLQKIDEMIVAAPRSHIRV